jgi:outer membrane murein-binding lipoprotein Lpp
MENQLRGKVLKICGCSLLSVWLSGCVSEAAHQETVAALGSEISSLEARLEATQASLQSLTVQEANTRLETSQHLSLLRAEVRASMDELPAELARLCSTTAAVETQCEKRDPVQPVVMAADKMLLCELERVWIEPPGATLTARIDTGASSSSLHAEELIGFERDGDDWVRFNILVNNAALPVEAQVARYVRVYQQADADGSRRPVVNLRIRLGDVQDTFEFTLADRSHLDYQIILGRNFLTDMALIDVGKKFIQPQYQPEND